MSSTATRTHDCDECLVLGPLTIGEQTGDLYAHERTHGTELIWRFGEYGDYLCRTFDDPDDAMDEEPYSEWAAEAASRLWLVRRYPDKVCKHPSWQWCACCHICGQEYGH